MTSYQRLKKKLELERKANERLRLQTLILSRAIHRCGGTMTIKANQLAYTILGFYPIRKRAK